MNRRQIGINGLPFSDSSVAPFAESLIRSNGARLDQSQGA